MIQIWSLPLPFCCCFSGASGSFRQSTGGAGFGYSGSGSAAGIGVLVVSSPNCAVCCVCVCLSACLLFLLAFMATILRLGSGGISSSSYQSSSMSGSGGAGLHIWNPCVYLQSLLSIALLHSRLFNFFFTVSFTLVYPFFWGVPKTLCSRHFSSFWITFPDAFFDVYVKALIILSPLSAVGLFGCCSPLNVNWSGRY